MLEQEASGDKERGIQGNREQARERGIAVKDEDEYLSIFC